MPSFPGRVLRHIQDATAIGFSAWRVRWWIESAHGVGHARQSPFVGRVGRITQPFRIGDQIVVSGFEGTVEDIQTRATFIRTYDGRRVVVPNAGLFTDTVVVNTAFPQRRLEYDVGIGIPPRICAKALTSSPSRPHGAATSSRGTR